MLDTGSSDLYFDASSAPACQTTGRHSCKGGTFDASKSSSYQTVEPAPAFNTSFGDGSTASGPFGRDTVCVGDVCIENVQFGVADTVRSRVSYASSLMGLGYSLIEATHHKYPNMPEVMADAGIINSRLYSVYLNDEGATSGSVLFGGIDTSKYTGPLQTLDLLPEVKSRLVFQFITTVTAMSITTNGQKHPVFAHGSPGYAAYGQDDLALPVLLDTGSSAWSVPPTYFEHIIKYFPFVDRHLYCQCSHADSDISVTVTMGGKVDITVPAKEFIVPLYNATDNSPEMYPGTNEQACAFMIQPDAEGTGEGFEPMGDAMLRSMYLVYDLDQGQVSIAQANVNSTSTPDIKIVKAGPGGVANAAKNVVSAPQVSGLIIAPQLNATASFKVMSAKTTIGGATGANAVPNDARPGSSGSSSSSSSSGAAVKMGVPGADWSGLWVGGIALIMAGLGAGLMA